MSIGQCQRAAGRRRDAMPAKLIGNGLRELDLFLTDLIVEAGRIDRLGAAAGCDPGVHPGRRIFSAAEAWRRNGPQLGLGVESRARLRQMRAAQNRQCFGQVRGEGAEAAMQRACADYAQLASDVLNAVRARSG
ncbi:hypothetical protein [Sphingobium limneticum]|uniref:Uncharacterized protein n=1 Tax=Sphingobium limneticum TaxID=1007511 RepID=A0A5J5I3A6_9SPHN|nr:hypothetical protein [Sphingobium limneticum]KAA9015452.1 hypothetical protein F4U96_14725 [Sphingobium limneticum]KAA9029416.1 hypothetical protein F4U95_12895 [Sphingobium limneticum]